MSKMVMVLEMFLLQKEKYYGYGSRNIYIPIIQKERKSSSSLQKWIEFNIDIERRSDGFYCWIEVQRIILSVTMTTALFFIDYVKRSNTNVFYDHVYISKCEVCKHLRFAYGFVKCKLNMKQ